MAIQHVYSQTVADGTATSVVRPSDWNSNHKMVFDLSGNTAGSAAISGNNITLVGGNNVTLSADTAGSKLVFSAAAGGGAAVRSYFDNLGPMATASGAMGIKQPTHNQLFIFPLKPFGDIFNGNMTLNTLLVDMSVSGSTATLSAGGISTVLRFGLYSVVTSAASMSLSLINSFSKTFGLANASSNNSTYWNGNRWISVHSSEWSSQPVLSDNGMYVCGIHFSTQGSSAQTFANVGGFMGITAARSGVLGQATATNTTFGNQHMFHGMYGTTTNAMPTGINITQINKQSASANFVPHLVGHNFTNLGIL